MFCFKNKKYHYGRRDIYNFIIAHYGLTFTLKCCDNYVYVSNRVEYIHSECLNNIPIIIIFWVTELDQYLFHVVKHVTILVEC